MSQGYNKSAVCRTLHSAFFPYIVMGMSLRDLLRFIVLACVFATPFIGLIVAESMFFPFITGKNFTFRILVEVMLGAWTLLMFIDEKYRPRFSWILVAAGAFLAVIAVADFTGVNPYKSFWSNYERMEGLITHVHLFLYFIISASVLATEEMWKWFWRTSLGASLIVAMYAFSQLAGKAEIHQGATRLDATFGNSAYLAVYALFNIFIATFLYFRSDKQKGLHWIYPVVALVNFVVLYYTQTRGTLLGLVGGAFLAAILVALFGKEHPRLKRYALWGTASIVVLIGLFIAFRDASWIQASPTLQRMASISLSDKTTDSRFMIWKMSWEGFKERPIFGWGQENFLYVFSKHYNAKMWNQEPWFDRSHDVFFDWLVAGGALGLLTYLSMFAALLYYLWFTKKHHFTVVEKSIFTGMLAGYFIHNIFVFDNLTSYIVFFGLLGYMHTLSAEEPTPEAKEVGQKKKKDEGLEAGDLAIAGIVVLALTIGMVYYINIRNINHNIALIDALRNPLVDDGKGNKTKIALEPLLQPDLFGTGEAREQLAQFAIQTLDPRVPQNIREQFYNLTDAEFGKEIESDPDNLRTQSFAAAFYARFGQYDKALPRFTKSIELSPARQSTYVDLSMMYTAMGRYADAVSIAKTAYELEPANTEAALAYATTLIYNKQFDIADELLPKLGDTAFDNRIVNAYGNTGNYAKVVATVNEKIAKGQAVGHDYFSLASGLMQLGQKDAAIAAVEKGVSLDASLKDQGDQLIKQIQGGK